MTGVASMPRQALTYVAGYVAAKCSACKTLGQVTPRPGTIPRDERYAWIDVLSPGGLTVPSRQWLEQLGVTFAAMHKDDMDRGLGVVQRLTDAEALNSQVSAAASPRTIKVRNDPDAAANPQGAEASRHQGEFPKRRQHQRPELQASALLWSATCRPVVVRLFCVAPTVA